MEKMKMFYGMLLIVGVSVLLHAPQLLRAVETQPATPAAGHYRHWKTSRHPDLLRCARALAAARASLDASLPGTRIWEVRSRKLEIEQQINASLDDLEWLENNTQRSGSNFLGE